jgi:GTP-binding protein
VLILDIRRTPVEEDLQMLAWLRTFQITPIVVVTKCDKVSKNERAKQTAIILQRTGLEKGDLSFFSALSREGKDGIWDRIDALLARETALPEEQTSIQAAAGAQPDAAPGAAQTGAQPGPHND